MTLRFLKCLVLVALVHIFGAAMVFGAYHFAKAGEGLAENDQPDGTPKTIVNETNVNPINDKGTDGKQVQTHKVKGGESYSSIAGHYGIKDWRDLRAHNGHTPTHVLQIGEELQIPSNNR
jgi:hypothetical protein